jgi:hypothetical protein
MRILLLTIGILLFNFSKAQQDTAAQKKDTVIYGSKGLLTLPTIFVKNNFDYLKVLQLIKEDTSFYKAFKNLRILNYTSYNDIQMLDKNGKTKASLNSKTEQKRINSCRIMNVLEENTSGDFYDTKHNYNYLTAELYAALFFTKGTVCGESNIITSKQISAPEANSINKHKEQLKTLFFNPGKKITGIPFIGDKLDLYDERAQKYYNYKLDIDTYNGSLCYIFTIEPKEALSSSKQNDIVVDEMITRFDMQTMQVLSRTYSLSYKAGVYDFDVSMEVEMTKFEDLYVPKTLRYKGNWNVIFKKRERGIFTATLFNFKKE